MKKKLLTFLCLMATVVLAACGFKKVDAGNYLKTSFSGVDTKGRITYQFNTEELITAFLVENPKADAKTESELKVERNISAHFSKGLPLTAFFTFSISSA